MVPGYEVQDMNCSALQPLECTTTCVMLVSSHTPVAEALHSPVFLTGHSRIQGGNNFGYCAPRHPGKRQPTHRSTTEYFTLERDTHGKTQQLLDTTWTTSSDRSVSALDSRMFLQGHRIFAKLGFQWQKARTRWKINVEWEKRWQWERLGSAQQGPVSYSKYLAMFKNEIGIFILST